MKTIKIFFMVMTGLALLSSCKKNDGKVLDTRSALAVTLNVLNVGTPLEASIDTFKMQIPTGRFELSRAFALKNNQNGMKLTITEKATGKLVMEKDLKKDEGRTFVSFFYMNGQMGKMPSVPPVEPGKITLTYMFLPVKTNYAQPVDIVLGKYYLTPKVFEEITRIKNVKANEFTEPVSIPTFPTAGHVYNGQPTSASLVVYIYKAGTNTLYIEGTGYTWNPTASSVPRPSSATAVSKLYIFSEAPTSYMAYSKILEL